MAMLGAIEVWRAEEIGAQAEEGRMQGYNNGVDISSATLKRA